MSLIRVFVRSATYERRFFSNNPWDLAMIVLIPFVTILVIWWIFAQTQITNLPIGVIDHDQSPLSNTLTRYLDTAPDLSVARLYPSSDEAQNSILQRDIYAIVTIPEDFERRALSGKPAPIVLQVNAQYGTHSGIVQKGVQSVVGTLSAGVEMQRLVKQGTNARQAATAYSPIGIKRVSLFNAANNYQQFLASTIIPALLHILAMVVGATTIGRELRDKHIGHWYRFIATGTADSCRELGAAVHNDQSVDEKGAEDRTIDAKVMSQSKPTDVSFVVILAGLAGKYFWPGLAYALWALLAIVLSTHLKDIAAPSVLMSYISLVFLLLLSFWLGAIFTLGSFSLRAGLSAAGFISAPSYAFAGITYPYIAIRDSAKYWADALPLTHYLKLHIAQLQMQAPIMISLPIVYGLALATLIAMALTALLTKYALARPERWGAR